MKLINKISYNFLIISFSLLIGFSVAIYYIVESTIINETDEQLTQTSQEITDRIAKGEKIDFKPYIELKPAENSNEFLGFRDIELQSNSDQDEEEPFREYSSIISVDGNKFILTVRSSVIEKDEMLFSILIATIVLFIVFVFILFFINKSASQKVFKDFYNSLNKLTNFSVTELKVLNLEESKIDEFNQLNNVLKDLSEKAINEYSSLKEFSEETNHEIQTPIAVIKTKLDILLQSENLKENEFKTLSAALNNLNRLERINKSLLFLNKLENNFSFKAEEINLISEIDNILESLAEIMEDKKLTVSKNYNSDVALHINHTLIVLLLNNIFSNAIKHNIQNGFIDITVNNNSLIVANSGLEINDQPERMFERFRRGNSSPDSTGLGLTIIKRLCDYYNFKIKYEIENTTHNITIEF